MAMGSPSLLPLWAFLSVVALVVLIARVHLNAFVALTLVSAGLGLVAGLPPASVARAYQDGVGATLGFIAPVIGLGTIFGRLLEESGGAGVLARRATQSVGVRALPWAVAFVGFLVGLPVFFSVGLVLLLPIVASLAEASGLALVTLALPLVAGLSASHGLVPPHPGPLVAIQLLHADTGLTILFGVAAALPAVAAALLYAGRLGPLGGATSPAAAAAARTDRAHQNPPGVATTTVMILLPVGLMLGASLASLVGRLPHALGSAIAFLGEPIVALLVSTLAAWQVFGRMRGFSTRTLLRFCEDSLTPVAGVLLVVGAGGGFGRVLAVSGVGEAVAHAVATLHLSPLVFGWIVAALLRLAVGSATVAVTTAAGLVAPLAAASPEVSRELLVVALGAGSIVASHVNDGGFWLVKEYLGLDVPATLKSWTVIETVLSVVALGAVLVLSALR
jgi:gluconate:H+ symporter, GntP family